MVAYKRAAQDVPRALKQTSSDPQVARELKFFLAEINKIKTADQLVDNDRVYRFVLRAFGLDDLGYAKGLIRKVLKEGVENPRSIANRLMDERYRELARVFDFGRLGPATTAFDAAQQGTADRYVRQLMEQSVGAQSEGARLALYFARKAPAVNSTLGLLADPALLKVVQGALDLPPTMSLSSLEKQSAMIEAKLRVADLKNPAAVDKLLTRFTASWDRGNASTASGVVLAGAAGSTGLSMDTLMAINTLRRSGT